MRSTDQTSPDQSVANAGLLFDAVHGKLVGLGDTTLVLPAHGPGSVCGSSIAERHYSTTGDEKRYNEVFTLDVGISPRNRAGVVTCGVGHRARLGVGILLKAGFADVRNLLGGMKAWQALELPLE